MNALTTIAIAGLISIAMGCGDTAATGEQGGTDSGPAGPGAGPGPTSSGVGAMGAGSQGGDGTGGSPSTTSGGGSTGDGGSGGALDCVEDPVTHVEIINACTDSDYVDKAEQIANWNEGDPLPPLP